MAVDVVPIADADVAEAAVFLHTDLDGRLSPDAWAAAIRPPWQVDAPNHGYLLRDGDRVVGVYLAFYADRTVRGRRERFCNLGAWSVRPEYRMHSLRLLRALLRQPGMHFTDLSPSGPVVPLNARLRFRALDTATALIPGLPWPTLPGRVRISADPDRIAQRIPAAERERYRDHASCAAARHLVLTRGDRSCYVVFRRVRRKNLPVFAAVLHVSDPELFAGSVRALSRYLLFHHGIAATLAELRIVGRRPAPSLLVAGRPKMFRSDSLEPGDIDDLYSELTCVPW